MKNESNVSRTCVLRKITLKINECGLELVITCCDNQRDTRHENAIIFTCASILAYCIC